MKTLIVLAVTVGALVAPHTAYAEAGKDDLNQIQPHRGPFIAGDHDQPVTGFHSYPGRHTYPRHGFCARHRYACHW